MMSPHKKSKHKNTNDKQPTQATIRIQTLAVLCCVFSPSTAPSMLRRDVSHRVDVGSEVEALQVLTPRLRGFGLPISLQHQPVVDLHSSSKVVELDFYNGFI
jgi:hypothetical protein